MVWDDLPLVTGAHHTQTGVECHAFVEEVGKSDQIGAGFVEIGSAVFITVRSHTACQSRLPTSLMIRIQINEVQMKVTKLCNWRLEVRCKCQKFP